MDNYFKFLIAISILIILACSIDSHTTIRDYRVLKQEIAENEETINHKKNIIKEDTQKAEFEKKSWIQYYQIQRQGGNLALNDLNNREMTNREFRDEADNRMEKAKKEEKVYLNMFEEVKNKERELELFVMKAEHIKNNFSTFFGDNELHFIILFFGFTIGSVLLIYSLYSWNNFQMQLNKKLISEVKSPTIQSRLPKRNR